MKPTENGDCVNAAARLERPWNRLLVPEGLVRTRFVVEADVLGDDAPEVILTEDEDVVEQLSAERTGEALSEGIHVWRAYRRAYNAHPRRSEYFGEPRRASCRGRKRQPVAPCPWWRSWPAARTTRRSAHTSPRHGESFGDAGPGRRVRTPRGTARRTSARSHTPTSRGFAGTSTSSARRLGVESGACTAESFACTRGCLA